MRGGRNAPAHPDRILATVTGTQHGVAARAQLLAAGLSRRQVDHRRATGVLRDVHRGVYAAGTVPLDPFGHWMAAVLACGDGAVLSHRSAAALHGLRPDGGHLEVTVTGTARTLPTLTCHRTRRLRPDDVVVVEGIAVTSVGRTLVDLAEVVGSRPLWHALNAAERRQADAPVRPIPGRRGTRSLLTALADHGPGVADLRSPVEELALDFCVRHGLPRPATNVDVEGLVVDLAWPRARLVVEVDSGWHDTRAARLDDQRDTLRLQARGWHVVRVRRAELARDDPDLVAVLRSRLGRVVRSGHL